MTENKELLIKDLISLDKICKDDDYQEKELWFCKKCNKKIIEGYCHRKYCNSKKKNININCYQTILNNL